MTAALEQRPVLIVDDEPGILRGVSMALRSAGFSNIITLEDSRQVLPHLEKEAVGAIVLDLQMPHVPGIDVLRSVRETRPEIPVVILTANREVDQAVACMKEGAYDYHVKPVEMERLIGSLRRAEEARLLRGEVDLLRNQIFDDSADGALTEQFVTINGRMRSILRYVAALGPTRRPVLIHGETGTGKDMVARALHQADRPDAPFVKAIVSALDDEAFLNSVFGNGRLPGAIREANGGTLYLDGLSVIGPASQARLLQLLDTGMFTPHGSTTPVRSAARLVVSTDRDLEADAAAGTFRRDLCYRLGTRAIHIPPLRERSEDIPFLLQHFTEIICRELGRPAPDYPSGLLSALTGHPFPGNVRELEARIREALSAFPEDPVPLEAFRLTTDESKAEPSSNMKHPVGNGSGAEQILRIFGHFPSLEEAEDYLIEEALKITEGNQKAAAGLLQITRQTIHRRTKKKRNES